MVQWQPFYRGYWLPSCTRCQRVLATRREILRRVLAIVRVPSDHVLTVLNILWSYQRVFDTSEDILRELPFCNTSAELNVLNWIQEATDGV